MEDVVVDGESDEGPQSMAPRDEPIRSSSSACLKVISDLEFARQVPVIVELLTGSRRAAAMRSRRSGMAIARHSVCFLGPVF